MGLLSTLTACPSGSILPAQMKQESRQLTNRAERILAATVEASIEHQILGSARLRQIYDLPWSAATIRNELAALEQLGLLSHAYTSGGRFPSVQGLRYYVDHLLASAEIPVGLRQKITESLNQVMRNPVTLGYRVSHALSHASQQLSLVQTQVEGEKSFMVAGQEHCLGQPEFADSLKLKDLFQVLAEEDVQARLFRHAWGTRAVQVLIGAEALSGSYRELFEDVGMVMSPFTVDGRTQGTVGVLGPKYMDYRRLIPLVDYTAQSLQQQLTQEEVYS